MANLLSAVPASLRRGDQVAGLRASAAGGFAAKPYLVSAQSLSFRSRAARLPQEGEDAKITGTTRSLARRVLGLNVAGSLRRPLADAV